MATQFAFCALLTQRNFGIHLTFIRVCDPITNRLFARTSNLKSHGPFEILACFSEKWPFGKRLFFNI